MRSPVKFQIDRIFMGKEMQYFEISPTEKYNNGFWNGDRGLILLCLSQGEGNYSVSASQKVKIMLKL